MEECAIERDCSHFEFNDVYALSDLPPFPQMAWQSELSPQERQAVAGVYLAKITEHFQGRVPDVWTRNSRPNHDRSRNGRISEALKKQSLYPSEEEPDSPHQDREEREDQAFGPS